AAPARRYSRHVRLAWPAPRRPHHFAPRAHGLERQVSLAAVRRTLLVAGLALLAGPLIAPALPISAIFAASAAWYLALVLCAGSACVLIARAAGRAVAVTVLALGLAAPIVLTALPLPPALAVHLPCPRNWGWLPTWELRPSPMGSVAFTIGGAPVKVCYGRPAA